MAATTYIPALAFVCDCPSLHCNLPVLLLRCLATVNSESKPSARMVLLKVALLEIFMYQSTDACMTLLQTVADERSQGYSSDGFIFYTNSNSRKGKELQQHDYAAMVMHWAPLERQVRVEGRVEMVSSAEADHYFHTCAA